MARISTFASIIAVGLTHDTGTRVPKVRTVWRHFQVFASFALHQVDCLAADKRAASVGSAVFSHSYWRMSQSANEIAHSRFCTQRRACLKDACVPCEAAMAQQAGCATKMAAQHTCPLGAALFVLARSQQGKRPRPRRKYAGTGKPQAAFQPSDMCQTPERTSGMTYRILRGGRG